MSGCEDVHKIRKSQNSWNGRKLALVCCSNGLPAQMQSQMEGLIQ